MPSHPTVSILRSPIVAGRYSNPTMPGASSTISTFPSLSMTERNKHDSFNMSGSVFLITSDGKTVSLPIPSESSCDPLNWKWQKRAVALSTVGIFAYSALIVTQGASVVSSGLAKEFSPDVGCNVSRLFHYQPMLIDSDFLDQRSFYYRSSHHRTYTVHGSWGLLVGAIDPRTWTKTSISNCFSHDAFCVFGCICCKDLLPAPALRISPWTSGRICA
jgi:hypothetical protein